MKKLIAIALAALMLLASAAFAETANTLSLGAPRINFTIGEETRPINLDALRLNLSFGSGNGKPTVQLSADSDAGSLLAATLQLSGNRALLAVDGLSDVYGIDLGSALNNENIGTAAGLAINSVSALGGTYLNSMIAALTQEGENGLRVREFSMNGRTVTGMVNRVFDKLAEQGVNLDGYRDVLSALEGPAAARFSYDPNTGAFALSLSQEDKALEIAGTLSFVSGDVSFRDIDESAGVVDLATLTDEGRDKLKAELNDAFGGLADYVRGTNLLEAFTPAA